MTRPVRRVARRIGVRAGCLAAVWSALVAAAPGEPPLLDVFFGTLSLERGDVILTRCDLAATRYLLRDGAGSKAVTRYRANAKPAYAEVMASYDEEGGRDVLTVAEFAAQIPGKSCHLLDALEQSRPQEAQAAGTGLGVRADIDAALVGHYYLSGVMETGSELLLRPDGRFDWSLSYGAVDQIAQGRWRVERSEVVLTATQPGAGAGTRPAAPFTSLRLHIVDGALISADLANGRYERHP